MMVEIFCWVLISNYFISLCNMVHRYSNNKDVSLGTHLIPGYGILILVKSIPICGEFILMIIVAILEGLS
jgi:hypothetical protein